MVFNAKPVCTDLTDIGLGRVWRRLGLSSRCLDLPEKSKGIKSSFLESFEFAHLCLFPIREVKLQGSDNTAVSNLM